MPNKGVSRIFHWGQDRTGEGGGGVRVRTRTPPPARLPAQLDAPQAHQSARFTACSASRRPVGSLRQAVLLNAAPAGSLAGALKLNAPQPRPLASGEDAAANKRCWFSYNSCQWVSDMARFCGHVAGCIIVDVSVVNYFACYLVR